MKTKSISDTLALGVKFIQKQQKPNGEIKNQTTIFYHALTLTSLSSYQTPTTNKIINKLSRFLTKHKKPNWSYNYWTNSGSRPSSERYPDDWDDTACSLAALSQINKPLPGKALAHAIRKLNAFKKAEGGPYFTWMTDDKSAQEIDIAVNANIAYFLSLQNAFPKRLHNFLNEKVSKNNSFHHIMLVLSLCYIFYHEPQKQKKL